MIPLTLPEIAAAVGGRLHGLDRAEAHGVAVSGPVVIDSRQVVPGALFVAMPGEHVDGHDFVHRAIAGGAVAALGTRALVDPDGNPLPMVLVDDATIALGGLAKAVRAKLSQLTVVGITGSSGKTSTKDLTAQVLARLGQTVAPQNSFNNEIGVPLTLLRCDEQTRFLVAELGARHPGNISYLCDIVQPEIGIVLNVGAAHAGEFGSREATARTKGELVEALPAHGLAVLNADDDLVAAMAGRSQAAVCLVGQGAEAAVRAEQITLDEAARAHFDLLDADGARARVRLRVHGAHHIANALAVAATARHLGMALPEVAQALSEAGATSAGRMQVSTRSDGVVIVNDAYNANPDSLAAALAALRAMTPLGARSWAVLGEMLELGAESAEAHAELGRLAIAAGVHQLVAVGEGAAAYLRDISQGGHACAVADLVGAFDLLQSQLRPTDVVLLKASRAVALDRLAEMLHHAHPGVAVPNSDPKPGQDAADNVESSGAPLERRSRSSQPGGTQPGADEETRVRVEGVS